MPELSEYQKSALDFHNHISLTANAGSGKTFVLAKRFVAIALSENVDLSEIVAITFTDKAAGELYAKISREIDDQLKQQSNQLLKNKLIKLRRHLVSANISTIHSFCISVLKEFSPEAGLDANFIPVDNSIAGQLVEQSIEESLDKIIRDESISADLKYLIRIIGSKEQLTSQIEKLIYHRKNVEAVKEKIYSQNEELIAEYFRKKFEEYFELIFGETINKIIKSIRRISENVIEQDASNEFADAALHLLDQFGTSADGIHRLKILKKIGQKIFPKNGTELRKQKFLSLIETQILSDEIQSITQFYHELRSIPAPEDPDVFEKGLAKFGLAFLNVYENILENYRSKKDERGYLDFEDILLYTKKLLQRQEVRRQLNSKYHFIMIDEYQDTNELQYQIFMPILSYLKEGNLFVVGDEKQSIYMFREAEIEIFEKTNEDIAGASSKDNLKKLPHSFRLAPNLAVFTNVLFSKLFEKRDTLFNEVGYDEIICSNSDDHPGRIEILAVEDQSGLTEAELVAQRILNLVESSEPENFKFKDFAVLCQKRKSFFELEETFAEFNIPFRIVGGKGFFQRQTIYDIYMYLAFLLNPADEVYLAGILRAPFFSLSDANLMDISRESGENFLEKLYSFGNTNSAAKKAAEILRGHINIAKRIGIQTLIRKILSDTGYWYFAASSKNADQELANIEKLILIANKYGTQSFKTLFDFVDYLKNTLATVEDESQAPLNEDDNAVNVLTIHQSKGLEFNAVILFDSNQRTKRSGIAARYIEVDKSFGILTKLPEAGNYFGEYYDAPINGIFNFIIRKKEAAEKKRLLYVALTRAKFYLGISVDTREKINPGSLYSLFKNALCFDNLQDSIEIQDVLKRLRKSDGGFEPFEENRKVKINILKSVNLSDAENKIVEKFDIPDRLLIDAIKSAEKNEIISASKLNVYSQCPVKYKLIYELGYQKLFGVFNNASKNETVIESDEAEATEIPSDIRGRIIHKLLENETALSELKIETEKLLDSELKAEMTANLQKSSFVDEIYEIISNYYSSDIYNKLTAVEKYFNEYQIYTHEKDYFLYGIIDKLVFGDDMISVIDFKTDKIKSDEIRKKAEYYLKQLEFYAYLVYKRFGAGKPIEIKLIFVRLPEEQFSKKLSVSDLQEIGQNINYTISLIREKKFEKNKLHCNECHYSADRQLVEQFCYRLH